MSSINAKLLEKYQDIKKRKVDLMAAFTAEIEAKVRKYEQASGETLNTLTSENDELCNQMLLKDDKYAKCQRLLMEEKRKTNELSMEIKRLKSFSTLGRVEDNCHNNIVAQNVTTTTPESNSMGLHKKTAKELISDFSIGQGLQGEQDSIPWQSHEEHNMPDCNRGSIDISDDIAEDLRRNCMFQTLLESIVGLKISIVGQGDDSHFSVVDQSSGYTFKLMRLSSAEGICGEWFYHVLSLGTLERVALGWMREDIVFSSTMLPVFLQRISQCLRGVL